MEKSIFWFNDIKHILFINSNLTSTLFYTSNRYIQDLKHFDRFLTNIEAFLQIVHKNTIFTNIVPSFKQFALFGKKCTLWQKIYSLAKNVHVGQKYSLLKNTLWKNVLFGKKCAFCGRQFTLFGKTLAFFGKTFTFSCKKFATFVKQFALFCKQFLKQFAKRQEAQSTRHIYL